MLWRIVRNVALCLVFRQKWQAPLLNVYVPGLVPGLASRSALNAYNYGRAIVSQLPRPLGNVPVKFGFVGIIVHR